MAWHGAVFAEIIFSRPGVGKPPAGIKGAMKMLGLPGGEPREHIAPLTADEEKRLRLILIEAGCLEGPVAKRA